MREYRRILVIEKNTSGGHRVDIKNNSKVRNIFKRYSINSIIQTRLHLENQRNLKLNNQYI